MDNGDRPDDTANLIAAVRAPYEAQLSLERKRVKALSDYVAGLCNTTCICNRCQSARAILKIVQDMTK